MTMMTVSMDHDVRVLRPRALYTIDSGLASAARALAGRSDNRKEISGFEACAADQRAIDAVEGEDRRSVCGLD